MSDYAAKLREIGERDYVYPQSLHAKWIEESAAHIEALEKRIAEQRETIDTLTEALARWRDRAAVSW